MKMFGLMRRMVLALAHAAAAVALLAAYAAGAARVEEFAARSGLGLACALYHFAFAALPALYLRLALAWMRRGLYKGKKLQWEVDLAGAAAAVLLVAAGLAAYFLRVDLLARDVRVYYFMALWLAALCSVQRAPRHTEAPPDDRQPVPMPWPGEEAPAGPAPGDGDTPQAPAADAPDAPEGGAEPPCPVPAPDAPEEGGPEARPAAEA